ncbi:S1 family peptidase [Paludisphaera mucosa]|uniref:Serine protease n=1 Tax=Paludisphaera mucosa TaxID=3030827 RepID=A0ABT6F792_9BACT|nr:serine protease [Paludisphaera mucosa]MDG3003283.1 serine protease [Paludisphaera mucosa]
MRELLLSEALAYATVRIECQTPAGLSTGTGFYFRFCSDGATGWPAIVTNRHVVKGATTGHLQIHIREVEGVGRPEKSIQFELLDFENSWIGHPDPAVDLCMMLIGPLIHAVKSLGWKMYLQPLTPDLIPSDSELDEVGAVEDILMVGYPNGLWDTHNNMPLFRRGITASHPNLDYCGQHEFLIDAACFPGSSGSPVFLYNSGAFHQGGELRFGARAKLLGVLYEGPTQKIYGDLVPLSVEGPPKLMAVSRMLINLGHVIKSHRLLEFEPLIRSQSAAPSPLEATDGSSGA